MSASWQRPSLATRARLSAYVASRAPLEWRFPFRAPAAIERAQRRRLRATVTHAWEHVPYYRETMRRLGLTPADLRTEEDLGKLPILERSELQRDPEYYVSRAHPIESLIQQNTAGSTGAPRTYFRDTASLARDAIHFTRLLGIAARLAGKRVGLRQVSILPPISSAGTFQAAYRATSLLPSKAGVENTRLSLLDPPAENIARLNELEPDVIFTFGSYLESLFVHLSETGERFHRPAAVIYGADPLSNSVRGLISERFGIGVLSSYTAVEMPQIGFECERHRGLHHNRDLYPLRIVDPDDAEATTGESGDVVVSNLVNRGTVLVNYRLGDLARRLPEACDCGRNLPMISLVEGRSEDWLITESGRSIHPQAISMWLKHMREVLRYQVVQEAPTRFRIAVIAVPGCDRAEVRQLLERKFRETFGDETALDVSFPDSLPRTEAGKVRSVISEVGQARSAGA